MSDFSSINPALGGGHGGGSLGPIHRTAPVATGLNGVHEANRIAAQSEDGGDRVELSNFARWLGMMKQLPEVRSERIDSVRSAIAAGNYDTDEKLNQALDALIEDVLE